MHAGAVKPHLYELLDLAEAQFLEHLCLLLRPKSSVPSKERNYTYALGTGQIGLAECRAKL